MNNKKNEIFYNINLTNLRKEYDDITPNKSPTYTFWKEHIFAAIDGKESVTQNIVHHLTSKKSEKTTKLENLNILIKFIFFAGSSLITAIVITFTFGTNAINNILGLFKDKGELFNVFNDKGDFSASTVEKAINALSQIYIHANMTMIQSLLKVIFVIILSVGIVLYFYVLHRKDKILKEINFLDSFIEIIEEHKAK